MSRLAALRARVHVLWAQVPAPVRTVCAHAVFWIALLVLNLVLLAPQLYVRGNRKWAMSGEALLLVVILAVLTQVPALGRGSRAVGLFGTWRTWGLAAIAAAIFTFESMRQVGHVTMGQQPLLYDATALGRHLFILGADLYGAGVYGIVAGMGATVVVAGLIAAWSLARIERGLTDRKPVVFARLGVVVALLIVAQSVKSVPKPRWSGPHLVTNLSGSYALWNELRSQVRSDAYVAYDRLELTNRPDIRIYVVESYGAILGTENHTKKAWKAELRSLQKELKEAGWHIASVSSTAPVLGGRSWLADATVMLGVPIAHQSTYQHVVPQLDRLPHLPKFLEGQGYATVVIRPKDRERPGVKLDNSFKFTHTVFHDDLNYGGRPYGWGEIPDQYTIGYVEDIILADLPAPRFAFFHLVTSHVPWTAPPPLVDHWLEVAKLKKGGGVRFLDRTPEGQLDLDIRRFRREEKDIKRKATTDTLDAYTETINYSLRAIAQQLRTPPSVPTLVFIMGDHQPPMMGSETSKGGTALDVPIHALSTDPALLEELIAAGFRPGIIPALPDEAPVRHEGLFSLLVRVLAKANDQEAAYYPHGAGRPPK